MSFTFAARAVDQTDLTTVRNQTEAAIRARLAQALTNGKECGEVPPDTDTEAAAAGLLAAVDGLALHVHLDPTTMPEPVALAGLNCYLASVLPGTCHHHD